MFGVTILGNNSAIPAFDRHPTAQIVTIKDHLFLVDCGEGTQIQIAKYKIRTSKIEYIFISHLHGDHYFGLIGLITSMSLLNREKALHIFAPKELEDIIQIQLNVSNTLLSYPLYFHHLHEEVKIVNTNNFTIDCFKVQHRIACWGFIFRENKMPRKINRENCLTYEIPLAYYKNLQHGDDYINKEGIIIKNELLTEANKPAKSYAYAADTIYDENVAEKVKHVNLLYHETTYLKDAFEKAALRFHCTSIQAAEIAKLAAVQKLLIGHFSSKYEKLDDFLIEAQSVFEQTELALEGITYTVI